MSILVGALERIMLWLQKYQPDYAASFLPGLDIEEIKAAEKELEFELPQEIYTLYQWRNGTEDDAKALTFPTMQFLPLDRAVYCSKGINDNFVFDRENTEEANQWNEISKNFIFIEDNCEYCGVPVINCKTDNLPVINIGEGGAVILYTSLTHMMLTLAESYETRAYYLDSKGYVCEDEYKYAQTLRKYNYDINESALSTFRSLLPQYTDLSQSILKNANSLESIVNILTVMSRFKDPQATELLIEAMNILIKNEKSPHKDMICCWIIKTLGDMYDSRAIESLTNLLLDDKLAGLKEEAQKALSKLRA
jgi:hypothetical protein